MLNLKKRRVFNLTIILGAICFAICFISCEGGITSAQQEKGEKPEEETGTESTPETGNPITLETSNPTTPETGTPSAPETGSPNTPENETPETGSPTAPAAPPHPRTFDYTTLSQYKGAPNSFLVDSMPADLRSKLSACLYTGQIGANGWYADAAQETATNTAAQAFFTAMAQYVNTAGGQDDFLKIKMIHDWVVDYLDYDDEVASGFSDRNTAQGSQSATNILRRGRNFSNSSNGTAVCEGYAALFHAFMEKLQALDNGITWAGRIRGWQGYPTGPYTGFSTDGVPTNHEWNQVMINGIKFIVDCTLDDPLYGGGSSDFLFPDPSRHIYTCIPKYNNEQLLDDDGKAPWDSHVVTWTQYVRHYTP